MIYKRAAVASHAASALIRYPRIVSQLATTSSSTIPGVAAGTTFAEATAVAAKTAEVAAAVPTILPSLGASGAIYASVVMALAFPDLHVSLTIPPFYPIPIQYGVGGGLVLVDVFGVLRGWRCVSFFLFFWVVG
jgi:rhomboid-like protein